MSSSVVVVIVLVDLVILPILVDRVVICVVFVLDLVILLVVVPVQQTDQRADKHTISYRDAHGDALYSDDDEICVVVTKKCPALQSLITNYTEKEEKF